MKRHEQMESEPQPLPPPHSSADEESAADGRQTILLVEDDQAIRRYLEVILQRAGYLVVKAGDGLEAMRLALTTHIDAVVTDAIMPHLSGQELCRILRSQSGLSRLPLILLSGLENSDAANSSVADVYMAKPVSPTQLVECLKRLL